MKKENANLTYNSSYAIQKNKTEHEAVHTLFQLIYIASSKLCKIKIHIVGINIAVLLVKNLKSARSVMMRMTRPRTMSELSSFPAVTKRKLIE